MESKPELAPEVDINHSRSSSHDPDNGGDNGRVHTPQIHPDDEEPGFLDASADLDDLLPVWTNTLTELGELLNEINRITTDYAERMRTARKSNTKAMLAIAKSYADALMPTARKFGAGCSAYVEHTLAMNSQVVVIIASEGDQYKGGGISPRIDADFAAIRDLAGEGAQMAAKLDDFQASVADVSKMSRAVREPLRLIRTGAQQIVDAQSIYDDWVRRVDSYTAKFDRQFIDNYQIIEPNPEDL